MDFKETVQTVKDAHDIVDYVRLSGVDLKTSGTDQWLGLCPFHNEKTPSFTVSDSFQTYKCFGCGASGDIISYAQETHTIEFYEALKMLADEKGIEIKQDKKSGPSHDITGIRAVVKDAQKFYRIQYNKLDNSHPAKQEIIKRGLDVENELYGYSLEAPNDLYHYLKSEGHSDENIENSQLVLFKEGRDPWDFFHGRLMITMNDYLGRPVSFTSRKLYEDDRMKGKYVNGKESPVFHKNSILFGSDSAKQIARKKEEIYVVEGQFDQIAMTENGIENVVAASGTAFTSEHANLLLRMVGNNGKITFVMDGDKAGEKAAIAIFKSTQELHMNSSAVLLENGEDPCDYIETRGVDYLVSALDDAVPLHDFVINYVYNNMGGKVTSRNRSKLVLEVAKYAKRASDKTIIDNMLNKVSVLSATSIENVRDTYNNIDNKQTRQTKSEPLKEKQIKPKIELDKGSEADVFMFTALALLVRMPEQMIEVTPKKIHNKFKPFLKELGNNYMKRKRENKKWRFIAEDYEDIGFAKSLQNKSFLRDPFENEEDSVNQYIYLFNKANELYEHEYKQLKLSRALSSIIDSTDPKEIAEILKIHEEKG